MAEANKPRYWAVVPAAGRGSRFGASIPKQYLPLAGSNVLEHTLQRLLSHSSIHRVVVAVSLAFVDDFARIVRGMVLTLREQAYVLASRSAGAGNTRIVIRHILPNSMAPIIVQATVCVSYAILAEAGLSFLGLGVKPSTPTWGLILSDARSFFSRGWWLAVFPGLSITLTVLSINFLGDALRDMLDVREYDQQG